MVLRKSLPDGTYLGFVSIDWNWRTWGIGHNSTGYLPRRKDLTYEGRGWRQRLLADALAASADPAF